VAAQMFEARPAHSSALRQVRLPLDGQPQRLGGIVGMAIRILTPEETATVIARELYEAYIASSGGLNYQGLPCPTWENLTEAVRQHWEAVARRAWVLFTGS
jgi:hypothetical protein